jgi:ferredoxin-nitrate reductase
MLTTGRVVYHWHTRTKTGRSPELNAAEPDVFVEIARDDASALGIIDGDVVEINSRRGRVRAKVRFTSSLKAICFCHFTMVIGISPTTIIAARRTN